MSYRRATTPGGIGEPAPLFGPGPWLRVRRSSPGRHRSGIASPGSRSTTLRACPTARSNRCGCLHRKRSRAESPRGSWKPAGASCKTTASSPVAGSLRHLSAPKARVGDSRRRACSRAMTRRTTALPRQTDVGHQEHALHQQSGSQQASQALPPQRLGSQIVGTGCQPGRQPRQAVCSLDRVTPDLHHG